MPGHTCAVEGCLSDSSRVEDVGVTFHKLPNQTELRSKWHQLCRIPENKKNSKSTQICSRHFLRVDFCNYKGRKYLLRQGVIPSVFPWDKSKLEAIKSMKYKSVILNDAMQPPKQTDEIMTQTKQIEGVVKQEQIEIKTESDPNDSSISSEPTLEKGEIKIERKSSPINFSINSRINALDFNNKWHPAKILEVDEEENEVLVHFENNVGECNEWICMDSPRLRSLNDKKTEHSSLGNLDMKDVKTEEKSNLPVKFDAGERCVAYWNDKNKFPAAITREIENNTYEVIFDDGHVKVLPWNRLIKLQDQRTSSPLFDPIKTTKQERRDKKRKLNVAELFGIGKRQKSERSPSSPKPKPAIETPVKLEVETPAPTIENSMEKVKENDLDENVKWFPKWENGLPVGKESQLEFLDGMRKTFIVPDPNLPEGWTRHLSQRNQGATVGKWDTFLVSSSDGKKFRSRVDIKAYLETTKSVPYDENKFHFGISSTRQRRSAVTSEAKQNVDLVKPIEVKIEVEESENTQNEEVNMLKIPIVDNSYKCPIEGCGKNFRKENLAQMHVKHYHPEFSKFLDTTPNVADLAYARTVGDALDKSPTTASRPLKPKVASTKSITVPSVQPSSSQPSSPCAAATHTSESDSCSQASLFAKTKDSEIIKLLTAKPFDMKSEGRTPLPSGLPPDMYPNIELKDLLSKSEGIPKRDDLNLRTLSTTRPPMGIKTLLPVRKATDPKRDDGTPKQRPLAVIGKRKKELPAADSVKIKEEPVHHQVNPQADISQCPSANSGNFINEGGELIKIVRMKQEEIINCTCGFTEEDGLMIQCEMCLCWQHAYCNNIQRESEVPEKYVCYICQHPFRQRSSRRFYHDQDWLKHGALPVGSYHSKEETTLQKRLDELKRAHDISGTLIEMKNFVHTLEIKLKVAQAKNHPKLYLWSKPWEKPSLPEKRELNESDDKLAKEEENELNKDLKSIMEEPSVPKVPQPEAAIELADCRLNLLEHIDHFNDLVMERTEDIEKKLTELEVSASAGQEKEYDFPRMRQTIRLLLRDISKMEEFSQNTTI